ncbi:hypothetical protein BC629DRAFT_983557 [Irpex lacteus]|nr:hypothetical protein BC629DRAFT_983557 [Irpex lacteus]
MATLTRPKSLPAESSHHVQNDITSGIPTPFPTNILERKPDEYLDIPKPTHSQGQEKSERARGAVESNSSENVSSTSFQLASDRFRRHASLPCKTSYYPRGRHPIVVTLFPLMLRTDSNAS